MPDRLKYSILLLLIILFSGCTGTRQTVHLPCDFQTSENKNQTSAFWEKVESLQDDLAALNQGTNLIEARELAETAIGYSIFLTEEYQVVRPAVLHNVLIRIGLRNRGLCYHWTEDLICRLQKLNLKTFQLRWGVAHQGSDLREHNSVVITARGQAFDQGIVLDPWRNSGDLYWARVKTDRYPWRELPPEQW
jgi:hypothetical protein